MRRLSSSGKDVVLFASICYFYCPLLETNEIQAMLMLDMSSSSEEEGPLPSRNVTLEISRVEVTEGGEVGGYSPPSILSPRSSTWVPITQPGGTLSNSHGFDYQFVSNHLLPAPVEEWPRGRGRSRGRPRGRGRGRGRGGPSAATGVGPGPGGHRGVVGEGAGHDHRGGGRPDAGRGGGGSADGDAQQGTPDVGDGRGPTLRPRRGRVGGDGVGLARPGRGRARVKPLFVEE